MKENTIEKSIREILIQQEEILDIREAALAILDHSAYAVDLEPKNTVARHIRRLFPNNEASVRIFDSSKSKELTQVIQEKVQTAKTPALTIKEWRDKKDRETVLEIVAALFDEKAKEWHEVLTIFMPSKSTEVYVRVATPIIPLTFTYSEFADKNTREIPDAIIPALEAIRDRVVR